MQGKLFYALIALAILSIALTVGYVTSHQQSALLRAPYRDPPTSPTAGRVAGAGIVEASTRNVEIGTFTSGVVLEVPVQPGQLVKRREVLLKLDGRDSQAAVAVQEAAVEVARRQLDELKQMPRPEDVLIAAAKVRAAEALVTQQMTRYERARRLMRDGSVTPEELEGISEALAVAREELASRRAEQAKVKAGTWEPDLAVAEAQVAQAIAALEQARTQLELRTVLAPMDGTVLQVNVRPGEYISSMSSATLIVFGNTAELHVRVDIDEVDIPRFGSATKATGYRRGEAHTPIPLTLLRVEPLVIPKESLTGEARERTDTRVLQAVFKVDRAEGVPRLYVGQQLDVFVEVDGGGGDPKASRPGDQ